MKIGITSPVLTFSESVKREEVKLLMHPPSSIATVLTIADTARGQVGHYGYGTGATRGAPELTRS